MLSPNVCLQYTEWKKKKNRKQEQPNENDLTTIIAIANMLQKIKLPISETNLLNSIIKVKNGQKVKNSQKQKAMWK